MFSSLSSCNFSNVNSRSFLDIGDETKMSCNGELLWNLNIQVWFMFQGFNSNPTKGGINIKVCHSGIPKVGDEHPFTSFFCVYQGRFRPVAI